MLCSDPAPSRALLPAGLGYPRVGVVTPKEAPNVSCVSILDAYGGPVECLTSIQKSGAEVVVSCFRHLLPGLS